MCANTVEVQSSSKEIFRCETIETTKGDCLQREQLDALIGLRGKIAIDYDWEEEERDELRASVERLHQL